MKISFVSHITSTDRVKIRVGGLEFVELLNLTLKDSAEIKQGDYIEAIYAKSEEGQGAFYRTNNYATNQKPVAVAEEPLQNQPQPLPDGQAQQAPVPVPAAPEPQEIIVTVGKDGDHVSINDAIARLEKDYPEGAETCKATIMLLHGFVIEEYIEIFQKDLSWITISSEDEKVAIATTAFIKCPTHC